MKKILISVFLAFALLYVVQAAQDEYLYRPITTNYQGVFKEIRMESSDTSIIAVTIGNTSKRLQTLDKPTATAFDSAAIVSVSNYTMYTSVLEQPQITYFTGGVNGQEIWIKASVDSLFILDSDTLNTGSASLTLDTGAVVGFKKFGSVWEVISVNNPNTDRN